MIKTSPLARLVLIGVAVTAVAACTPRRPVDTGAGGTAPVTGPQYPTNPSGPVDGGGLGAAVPGSEQDFVVNVGDRV
ncbi:MAG: peptidoglycan-associated lipoprotein, partial [Brevundimonas sp.]|nr:peptidoglycan-associated lipoprotein [Brevundimonas sp.]